MQPPSAVLPRSTSTNYMDMLRRSMYYIVVVVDVVVADTESRGIGTTGRSSKHINSIHYLLLTTVMTTCNHMVIVLHSYVTFNTTHNLVLTSVKLF